MTSARIRSKARLSAAVIPAAALSFQFFVGQQAALGQLDFTWVGANGNWGNSGNWMSDTGTPPPNAIDATVYLGNNGVVNLNGGSFACETAHIGHSATNNPGTGTLNVDPGSYLYVSNDSYIGNGNNGSLNISGGQLVMEVSEHFFLGGGPLGTGTAVVNITSGTLEFQSKYGFEKWTTTPGASTINMSGGVVFFNDATVTGAPRSLQADFFAFSGGEIRGIRQNTNIHSLSGNGSITFDNNSTATVGLVVSTNTTFGGRFLGGGGALHGQIVKSGAGELFMNGATGVSTYLDGTNIQGGAIKLGLNNVLGTGSLIIADAAGAALNLNGFSQSFRGISGGGTTGGNIALGGGTLTSDNAAPFTYGGSITGAGWFVKDGSAVQTLTGVSNYTGGTRVMTGILRVAPTGAINGGGDLVDTATVDFYGPGNIGNVTGSGVLNIGDGGAATPNVTVKSVVMSASGVVNVNAGATLTVATNGTNAGTSRFTGFNIAGGATPTASVDLNNNDMIVSNGSAPTIQAQIKQARNGGQWNQPGITSSAARTANPKNTTLGLLTGPEYTGIYGAGSSFDGFLVSSTDILVKYTYYGDTDFNGVINFDDYGRTDTGFNQGRTGWLNGDFDFSGTVNFDDYALIDLAFNTQSGTLRRAAAWLGGNAGDDPMDEPALQIVQEHYAQFGDSYAGSFLSAVPEPASSAVFGGLASLAMMRRRRRHGKLG